MRIELEKKHEGCFYIIEADRDGGRKYVSRSFPNISQYSKKIMKAKRFNSRNLALLFIGRFADGEYAILNPEVKKVKRTMNVE